MVTGKVRATPESCVDSNMGYVRLTLSTHDQLIIVSYPILLSHRRSTTGSLRPYSLSYMLSNLYSPD